MISFLREVIVDDGGKLHEVIIHPRESSIGTVPLIVDQPVNLTNCLVQVVVVLDKTNPVTN